MRTYNILCMLACVRACTHTVRSVSLGNLEHADGIVRFKDMFARHIPRKGSLGPAYVLMPLMNVK